MFSGIGRRLAILNALVVIAIIAISGGVTYLALRQSLNHEVDQSLESRLEPLTEQPIPGSTPASQGSDDDDHHDLDEEALRSGDTIVFIVDRAGNVVFNPRDLDLDGVPVRAGIERALDGKTDRRSVAVDHIGRVRVMTEPVVKDKKVVGAAQAMRSLAEHERELGLLARMTLVGVVLGTIVAVPAGLYLAARAMRPIRLAFEKQQMFVADASHELRTPLTLIRANAEYALQEPELPVSEIRPELTSILDEVDRTDRLSDDLLMLARADAGQLPLHRELVDLGALVRAAVQGMRSLDPPQQLILALDRSAERPVNVDRDRLVQVMRILIDNAIKHTPPEGRITVEASSHGQQATIIVRDTGAGIASEHLPRVFDRFYRVDRARSRATGGTGLGLPIAKALVEAHGGRISLASQVGVGTAVTVQLPVGAVGAASESPLETLDEPS